MPGLTIAAGVVVLAQAAAIAFFDWVPTALNRNLVGMTVRERLPGSIIHGTLGVAFSICAFLGFGWGVLVGAVWYTVVLVAAIRNWWVPYLFGVHPGEITPEVYERDYARNVRVLPRFRAHPVIPDVQHTLIHLAVLAAVVLCWVDAALLLLPTAG